MSKPTLLYFNENLVEKQIHKSVKLSRSQKRTHIPEKLKIIKEHIFITSYQMLVLSSFVFSSHFLCIALCLLEKTSLISTLDAVSIDQIFTFRQVLQHRYAFRRPTIVLILDIKAALNSVDCEVLWQCVIEMRVEKVH